MKGVSQYQIAEKAGVSRSTVAAVLSNTPRARVSEAVRQRVLATANAMGYIPNRHAQIVRKGSSGLIGILNFGGAHQVPYEKLLTAVQALTQEGYEPMVQDVFWFLEQGDTAIRRLLEARVEGILMIHPTTGLTKKQMLPIEARGIPTIPIGGYAFAKEPFIFSDKEYAFYELATHLLSLGHRRLVLLLGSDTEAEKVRESSHARRAMRGVEKAVTDYGMGASCKVHIAENLMHKADTTLGANLLKRGALALREILDEHDSLPDAVLCSNDSWALGALSEAVRRGLRVPEDIAIVGMEDEPFAEMNPIPITTVRHPSREIAEYAVQVLLEEIREKKRPENISRLFRGELIVRRSCGALSTAMR